MTVSWLISLTSLLTSSIAAFSGWRYYARFGRGTGYWGWIMMLIASISLAVSEFLDAYAMFQGNGFAELSDFFGILAEILLTVGFVRLFNRELTEEKIRQQKLEANLAASKDLLSATRQMTASLNLEETLRILLQRALKLTGADMAAIYLGEQRGKLAGRYFGIRRDLDDMVASEHELGSLTRQVLSTGRPVLMENLREQSRYASIPLPEGLAVLGGFPLQEKGENLGVLFAGFGQDHSFGEDQQLLLMDIADHGALALRNAALYEKVEELSLTDPLTGLANRRRFDDGLGVELVRARRYGKPLSVVIFDLDHFKAINDHYGHPAGDLALTAVAKALTRSCREADITARVGGEEFGMILPETEAAGAVQMAERVREQVASQPIIWEERMLKVTLSAGVAGDIGESLPVDAATLFRLADQALYRAKKGGRNRVALGQTSKGGGSKRG